MLTKDKISFITKTVFYSSIFIYIYLTDKRPYKKKKMKKKKKRQKKKKRRKNDLLLLTFHSRSK